MNHKPRFRVHRQIPHIFTDSTDFHRFHRFSQISADPSKPNETQANEKVANSLTACMKSPGIDVPVGSVVQFHSLNRRLLPCYRRTFSRAFIEGIYRCGKQPTWQAKLLQNLLISARRETGRSDATAQTQNPQRACSAPGGLRPPGLRVLGLRCCVAAAGLVVGRNRAILG